MIIRGSYAIKDIINRDINDYDIYITLSEFNTLKLRGDCEKVLDKYLLKNYLSKTIELNIIEDNDYIISLVKASDQYQLDFVLLENKLPVYILPLELSILEKMGHESPTMKKKWREDLKKLRDYYGDTKNIIEKYPDLYKKARNKNQEDIKNYILSKYYKKQTDINPDITLEELLSIIKREKTLQGVISILSGAYNNSAHSLYIKKNFKKLYEK